MSAIDRDVTARIGFAVMNELLDAAQQGKGYYEQVGINRETFADLATLSVAELRSVCRNPFLHLRIDDRVLALLIQSTLAGRSRHDLENRAIMQGASRTVMQRYMRMSYGAFNRRRTELGLDSIRNRPCALDSDEYHLIAELHAAYGSSHVFDSTAEHLRCLIHLSEHSGIDINRIYWYYYRDNENLFGNGAAGGTFRHD